MNRFDRLKLSSMNHWFPKVKDLVPVPKTVFVDLEEDRESHSCPVRWNTAEIKEAIETVGGYPAFIRTDQSSNKHDMAKASRISKQKEIDRNIFEVIMYNEMAGMLGLPYDNLVVREWLNLEHYFKAFNETPIAKELRFFIKDNEVQCHHFYWPEDSIKFYGQPEPEDKE